MKMLYQLNLSGGSGGLSGQAVYTAPNGITVTSSRVVYTNSNYYYMRYLFDGITNSSAATSYWLTNGGPATLDFDFNSILGAINSIDRFIIYPRCRDDSISDYRILVSNNKTTWTEVVSRVSNTYANCPYGTIREHGIKGHFRYVRIELYQSGNWGVLLNEIKVVVDAEEGYNDFSLGTQKLSVEPGWKRNDDSEVSYPNGYILYNGTGISSMYGGSSRIIRKSESVSSGTFDTIAFQFYGSKLRLLACTNPDRQQKMRIEIDGIHLNYFTSRYPNANIGQILVYEKYLPTKAIHDVQITIDESAEEGDFYLDAIDIDEDGYILGELNAVLPLPEPGWKRIDDNHPAIQYTPRNGWTSSVLADHYGGSAMGSVTIVAGNKFAFDFIGTKFRLITSKAISYSDKIKVTIDGTIVEYFSALDTYYYHKVISYEKTGLFSGRHRVQVEIINKPVNSAGYDIRLDAIDIDAEGRILHPQEVLDASKLEIGKRIRCNYKSLPDEFGYFSGLGEENKEFLPQIPMANPDGDFYLIAVDHDDSGKMMLLADRNVQGGVLWTTLNNAGLSTGLVLDKQRIPAIPILTSNASTDGSVIVSVSSKYSTNYDAWKVFNGNKSTGDTLRWVANNPSPAWLNVSFSEAKIIKHYALRSNTYNAAAPKDWTIQASNDGLNWTTLDRQLNQSGLLARLLFSFDNDTPYFHYRLHITATNGYTGYFVSLDEMQLYEEERSLSNATIKLPTGGVSVNDKSNDWDKYVVGSSLEERIEAGDNRVWNWSGVWSQTVNTISALASRTVRGSTVNGFSSVAATSNTLTSTGFRPMFTLLSKSTNLMDLTSSIYVRSIDDIEASLHVYKDHFENPGSSMADVTLPVTAADWKGYNIEVSGNYDTNHREWRAFDNSMTATYSWAAPSGHQNAWLIFTFNAPLAIAGYGVGARPTDQAQTPRDWIFYGSNDKANWTLLDAKGSEPNWGSGELRKYMLSEDRRGQEFRFFKWEISNSSSITQLSIQEFELYSVDQMEGIDQRRSFLTVPIREDLAASVTVKPHGKMVASVNVSPVYLDPLPSQLEVKHTSPLISSIAVAVSGRMRGTVSVIPPAKIEQLLSSVQDAFVRSKVPRLNYGEEQEMVVGRTADGEEFRSLIQFDLASIPDRQRITKAFLKLYVEGTSLIGNAIGIYEIQDQWTEFGVTWANTPSHNNKIKEAHIEKSAQYTVIDLTDNVEKWYENKAGYHGILLKAEKEMDDSIARLGTRERGNKFTPVLVVEYYNPEVKSTGYAEARTDIIVQQNKTKEHKSTITIRSTRDQSDFRSHIRILNPDMIESSITIRRDNMYSCCIVKRKETDLFRSELTVRNRRENTIDSLLTVSRNFQAGHITIRKADLYAIPSSVIIIGNDHSELLTSIGVSKPEIMGEISVVFSNSIPSTIAVSVQKNSSLDAYITIRRNETKELPSSIVVWAASSLAGSITVKSAFFASSIIVPSTGLKEIKTSIRVAEKYARDLISHIEIINRSDLFCLITIELDEDGSYAFIM